jgi:phage FluMu protein Com
MEATRHATEGLVDVGPRCSACGKKLAERLTRPWTIKCVRCKATNARGSARVSPEPVS